jgi:hypothetical protein
VKSKNILFIGPVLFLLVMQLRWSLVHIHKHNAIFAITQLKIMKNTVTLEEILQLAKQLSSCEGVACGKSRSPVGSRL